MMQPAKMGVATALVLAVWTVSTFDQRSLGAQAPAAIALVGGTLIDGTGAAPVRDSVVLIRGDRIERVGTVTSLPVPAAYEQMSTEGMTVLPGLWDMHVHLIYSGHPNPGAWFSHASEFERVTIPASARQMLMAGVTSVRDLAAPADAILGVKKRIASGEIPGPTLYAAGPALAKMAPNQPSPTSQFLPIADAADARAKTRQLLDAGADTIKIFFAERMSPEERSAIITEAHARGRKVAAHGQTDSDIRLGLEIGVDDFQHIGIDSPEFPPDIVASLRERVKRGPPLYWTPTVGANGLLNGAFTASKPEILDDPENYLGLPAPLIAEVKQGWAAYQPREPRPDTEAIVRRKIVTVAGRWRHPRVRQRRRQRRRAGQARHVDGCRPLGSRARDGSDDRAAAHDTRCRARRWEPIAIRARSRPASTRTSLPSAGIHGSTLTCCAIRSW